MIFNFSMTKEAAQEASMIQGIRPSGSHVVGWWDFNAEKLGDPRYRRYALVLTRSGRFVAIRGDSIRPIPAALFSHLRLMLP